MRSPGARAAIGLVVAAIAAGAALARSEHSAEAFVGTWLSQGELTTTLTTLRPDGRFTARFFEGVEPAGLLSGRWAVRDDAFVWTYEGKDAPAGDDVNAIVEASPTHFILREATGALSTFFRTRVPDPLAPEVLPVSVGSGWVLEDEAGQVAIRVSARETVAGRDCYRVDWIEGPLAYQSEYWAVGAEGVHVVGRRVLGRRLPFAEPYLLLKRAPVPGDTWKATVSAAGLEDSLVISVGSPERVLTPAGAFDALPVSVRGRALQYRRWYAPGVGLVQEEASLPGSGTLNLKKLKQRLE